MTTHGTSDMCIHGQRVGGCAVCHPWATASACANALLPTTSGADAYDALIDWIIRAEEEHSPGTVTLPTGRLINYDGDPYAKRLVKMVQRVLWVHTSQPGDEHAALRCSACIAGYNRQTGDLVHAAWPCQTIRALLAVDRSAAPQPADNAQTDGAS